MKRRSEEKYKKSENLSVLKQKITVLSEEISLKPLKALNKRCHFQNCGRDGGENGDGARDPQNLQRIKSPNQRIR